MAFAIAQARRNKKTMDVSVLFHRITKYTNMVLFWTPSSSNHHASVPTTRYDHPVQSSRPPARPSRLMGMCFAHSRSCSYRGLKCPFSSDSDPFSKNSRRQALQYNQAVHTPLHEHCDCWTAVGARSTWVGRSMQASSDKCHPHATGVAQNTKSLMSWSRHSSVPTAFATTILKAPLLHGVPDRALDSLYPKNTTRMSMNMSYTGTLCAWKSSHQLIFWQALH